MSIRDVKILSIKDDKIFEELCLDLWYTKLDHAQLNGRHGQKQNGVDIFGKKQGTSEWVGIQCKVKGSAERITEPEIQDEIDKALTFNPKLTEYIIATTASRDAKIQEFARNKTDQHHKNGGLFSVTVVSWDDIELDIRKESNITLLYKYYKDFFIDVKLLNNVIGRIIEISIGVGENCDTSYELMIGKTPSRQEDEDYFGINYYKNAYIIVNLSNRIMETFPLPCHPSDIERAFVTKRDAFIVAQWISSMKNIDDIIYGSSVEYKNMITEKEYVQFLEQLKS